MDRAFIGAASTKKCRILKCLVEERQKHLRYFTRSGGSLICSNFKWLHPFWKANRQDECKLRQTYSHPHPNMFSLAQADNDSGDNVALVCMLRLLRPAYLNYGNRNQHILVIIKTRRFRMINATPFA